MSNEPRKLQFVAAPASGWCDPETGVCHMDAVEEPTTAPETMNPSGSRTTDSSAHAHADGIEETNREAS